ncbi:hypothetical protein QAD02_017961 [Eretmocerus hayati]|uniref:Uncharacterized protein n=1 Tax=Eretmocerus hayati TaxID=131215 RepID=A0ACC2PFT3_9HYME|nr:hypothetical protein QAD02_017961 [Eretmocerus hayati]
MHQIVEKFTESLGIDVEEDFYGHHNEIALRLMGLWPFETFQERTIKWLCIQLLSLFLIVPLILGIIQMWGYNYDIVMENALASMALITFSIGHTMTYIDALKVHIF